MTKKDKKIKLTPLLVIEGIIGAILGFLLSQYTPLWGYNLVILESSFGSIVRISGKPFSAERLSLAPSHIFVFFLLGLLIAYLHHRYYNSKSNGENK